MRARVTIAFLLGILVLHCVPASRRPAAPVEEAIRAANTRLTGHFKKGDFDALASDYYAEDAVVLFWFGETLRGRKPIADQWRRNFEGIFMEFSTEKIQQSCDLAWERGRWQSTYFDHQGSTAKGQSGSYLVTWRWNGREWKAAAQALEKGSMHK